VITFRSAFALMGFRYEANLLLQHKHKTVVDIWISRCVSCRNFT